MNPATAPSWRPLELLEEPLVRASLVVPVLVTLVLVLLEGELRSLPLFLALTAAALGVAVGSVLQPRFVPLPSGWDRDVVWAIAAGAVGPLLAAVMLVWVVQIDVRLFAPLFGMVLLVNGFVAPWRTRSWLMLWVVLLWVLVVVGGGERDPSVLLLHLGGGLALTVTTKRTADALTIGYAQAAAARRAAERRAELLASVLRTQDLDPAVVLRSAADGLLALGFDVATVREVDQPAGVARLVEGAARGDVALPKELPLDDDDVAAVLATARPRFVAGPRRAHADLASGPLGAAVLYPVIDGDEVIAIVGAGTAGEDVTRDAREAAELLVAQAGEALLRARAYRADRETTRELQRLQRHTQDFLSTVSHELRTPLTVVQGLTATLSDRWDALEHDRRRDLLRRIDANAERLAAMVTRLLDTSQVSRDALQVRLSDVRLEPLLRSAVDRLDDVLAGYQVVVDVENHLYVQVDPVLFEHVIDNLLVNVATHTPPGTTASVAARPSGDRTVIEVHDDGPGVSDEDLPHLLERFYRGGDKSHRASTRGLGLGLALAAEVVANHGGRLEVGRGPGGGARFSFDVAAVPPR